VTNIESWNQNSTCDGPLNVRHFGGGGDGFSVIAVAVSITYVQRESNVSMLITIGRASTNMQNSVSAGWRHTTDDASGEGTDGGLEGSAPSSGGS